MPTYRCVEERVGVLRRMRRSVWGRGPRGGPAFTWLPTPFLIVHLRDRSMVRFAQPAEAKTVLTV
jgi:hypothetical protein